jgi:hypothetical protein
MKHRWIYFLPAAFFASYLLVSHGVSLFPVILGCALAAFLTWRAMPHKPPPSGKPEA